MMTHADFHRVVDLDAAKTIVRAGKLTATSRVLEVGIGTGRVALPLAKHIGEMYGVDLSRPMMLRLREKKTDEPIHLVQGDATHLPYRNNSLDAVVAVHIFHLIPNWQGVIAELGRVLKPDAPVIQCWATNDNVFKSLWGAWRSAVPDNEAADVGLSWEKNEDALQAIGWRIGDSQTFDYTYGRSPAGFVRQLENRIWSRTWRLSDMSLTAGVAAVKAVVARDYADAEAGVTVHEQFVAKTYFPPR